MLLNKETLLNIDELDNMLKDFPVIKSSKKIEYLNVSCAFDIETTSFYQGDEKMACMYCFVFGIDGNVLFAREWEDFIKILNRLKDKYGLSKEKRLICYVHNLAYEFQWICKRLKWIKVFATDERKPLTALCEQGIEFRCSYMLSGFSLAKTGENLTKYKVQKMVGDLDYSLMRHSKTPMTEKEIGYVWNDCLVVMAYIQEQIEANKNNISLIPLTKTGFVRRRCKENCLYPFGHTKANKKEFYRYQNYVRAMRITSPEMYDMCKRAFQGGFTHANPLASGIVQSDVTSYDFTSSYPSVLIAEKYPFTTPRKVQVKDGNDFKRYIETYGCLFNVTFVNIRAKYIIDNPISESKCFLKEDVVADNGRLNSASRISLTCTNVDYKIYRRFYSWDKMLVWNFHICRIGYLPTNYVKTILQLYWDKTTLKGVEGKEVDYMSSKNDLNSLYGSAVTDIIQNENTYTNDGEWVEKTKDIQKELDKYNDSRQRYLYYLWGVFCTAYARYNLFSGIAEFGNINHPELGSDYLYSDTDSVKVVNAENHQEYIKRYNEEVTRKIERALAYHHIPLEMARPKTKKGVEKPMGVWDYDGHYKRAKFLRAKCYMVEYDDGHHSLTISGLNKEYAIPFLERVTEFVRNRPKKPQIIEFCNSETQGKKSRARLIEWVTELVKEKASDIFELLSDDMYIPPEHTGKKMHTYVDDGCEGAFVDYLGNVGEFKELSYIHLEGCEYSLSMTDEYLRFLNGIREDIYG